MAAPPFRTHRQPACATRLVAHRQFHRLFTARRRPALHISFDRAVIRFGTLPAPSTHLRFESGPSTESSCLRPVRPWKYASSTAGEARYRQEDTAGPGTQQGLCSRLCRSGPSRQTPMPCTRTNWPVLQLCCSMCGACAQFIQPPGRCSRPAWEPQPVSAVACIARGSFASMPGSCCLGACVWVWVSVARLVTTVTGVLAAWLGADGSVLLLLCPLRSPRTTPATWTCHALPWSWSKTLPDWKQKQTGEQARARGWPVTSERACQHTTRACASTGR